MADFGFRSNYILVEGFQNRRIYTVSLYLIPNTYMIQCRRPTVSEAVQYLMNWINEKFPGNHRHFVSEEGVGPFIQFGDSSIEDAIIINSILVSNE